MKNETELNIKKKRKKKKQCGRRRNGRIDAPDTSDSRNYPSTGELGDSPDADNILLIIKHI